MSIKYGTLKGINESIGTIATYRSGIVKIAEIISFFLYSAFSFLISPSAKSS